MSFVVVQKPPRQPSDSYRGSRLLTGLMKIYRAPEMHNCDMFAFMEIVNRHFASGSFVWPVNAHLCQATINTVNNRLAFEWLNSFVKSHPDAEDILFLCNTCRGFQSYLAVPLEQPGPTARSSRMQEKQWLVCWVQDELFGQDDIVALKAASALFVAKNTASPQQQGAGLAVRDMATTGRLERACASVYKEAIDLCDDCIIVCSPDGSIIHVNKRAFAVFGEDVRPLRSKTHTISWLSNIIHPDDLGQVIEVWRSQHQYEQPSPQTIGRCRMIITSGRTVAFSLQIMPLLEDGRVINWIVYGKDIDKLELDLQAKVLTESKAAFLAEMSHEIRTPLSCIIGTADLFKYTSLNREQQEFVATISTCSKQLFQLIENVLDYSKIQDRKLLLNPTANVLEKIIYDSALLTAPEIHRKRLDFFVFISPELPDLIAVDDLRLRQVLTNLLANAVKFTAEDTMVKVTVTEEKVLAGGAADTDSELTIRFEIQDRGPGLPEGANQTLFESYVQLNQTVQSKFRGTGLGLAISKKLIALMGGAVWFESVGGDGCRFIFTIKAAPADCSSIAGSDGFGTLKNATSTFKAYLATQQSTFSVAVCVDSRDLAFFLLSVYGPIDGISASPADLADCSLGVDARNTVVVTDHAGYDRLLAMDASRILGAIVLIRSDAHMGRPSATLPAIVMKRPAKAAQLLRSTQELLVSAQLAASLGITTVSLLARKNAGASPVLKETPALAGTRFPLNIMVADDSLINIQLIQRVLKRFGYDELSVCEDGRQAVSTFVALAADRSKRVDVVFMDMEMPAMGGCEATMEIRRLVARHPGWPVSPHIVALTANAFAEDRQMCMESGMCRYLSKPIKWEALAAELEIAFKAIRNQLSCRCNEERCF